MFIHIYVGLRGYSTEWPRGAQGKLSQSWLALVADAFGEVAGALAAYVHEAGVAGDLV
jgi:hypothetical protein